MNGNGRCTLSCSACRFSRPRSCSGRHRRNPRHDDAADIDWARLAHGKRTRVLVSIQSRQRRYLFISRTAGPVRRIANQRRLLIHARSQPSLSLDTVAWSPTTNSRGASRYAGIPSDGGPVRRIPRARYGEFPGPEARYGEFPGPEARYGEFPGPEARYGEFPGPEARYGEIRVSSGGVRPCDNQSPSAVV